jgi:hypothetical protein
MGGSAGDLNPRGPMSGWSDIPSSAPQSIQASTLRGRRVATPTDALP